MVITSLSYVSQFTQLGSVLCSPTGGGAGAGHPEIVVKLEFYEAGEVCLAAEKGWVGDELDLVLYVREKCNDPSSEIACSVNRGRDNTNPMLSLSVANDQPYYLVIDSQSAELSGGRFTLHIQPGACPAELENSTQCEPAPVDSGQSQSDPTDGGVDSLDSAM